MNKTSLRIKVLYNDMGKAEKRIADWILSNPGGLIPLSVSELAEKCGCGDATVVRFSRRLGFGGYQELKISLAQEDLALTVSTSITKKDSCFEVFEKVCNDIYLSLEETKKALDPKSLERACAKIAAAGKILVFGLGNSASVASDAAHKLLRAGFDAFSYNDNHMQAIAAAQLKPGDAAIGISHSGSSKDIVEALSIAKERGAATIAITNRGKSPVAKKSDVVLFTDADETRYTILALNSRIAQLAIIDALYFRLVYQKEAEALKSIKNTERSLLSKKY